MENFNFFIEYVRDGRTLCESALNTEFYDVEYSADSRFLELSIRTKAPLELKKIGVSFEKPHKDGERFYANGYQAWTTSREYSATDRQRGVTPLACVHPKLKTLAAISGDYLFCGYPKACGIFHGFTYCYFRDGENVELFGSLDERSGFTVFKRDMAKGVFSIEKDVEGLTVDGQYKIFEIMRAEGSYDGVFDGYFERFGVAAPKLKSLSGYTSWYNYFQKIDESIILRDLEGLTRAKDKAEIFQIDDGYETFVGDWLDKNPKKFPNGMGYIAQKIHGKGLLAGLWLAPLNAQRNSRLAAEHPDWLIKNDKTGKPIVGVIAWGGAYSLDVYNPEVRAYLKKVFDTVLGEWRFDMLKLDFLYSQCIHPRNNKTRGTIMCETMEFLRELAGDKLILGCGVPLGAAFKYVDACRTGCDADLVYGGRYYNKIGGGINSEIISTQNSINNTIFRRHLNGRAFLSDPDVFFLRDDNIKFSYEQKLLLAKINNLFGGVLFVSDDVGKYNESQLELLKAAFTKRDVKIISAEYKTKTQIEIVYESDGKTEVLSFDIKIGVADKR
ncbi:MAG: alpha-galactosidase [Clostridiales bacterium]|jgi:alpha-galactosidase|nr:alpha-galactosidase [Clostridiales bacterium]